MSQQEPKRLKKWKDEGRYARLQQIGQREGRPTFILHDGPPFANGHIHIGHALNKVLKDMVIRSKSMDGYVSPYIPGWDTHGLPIELHVIKERGIASRSEDVQSFRQACREYALRFVEIQSKEFQRLGIWGDWDNPYLTLDAEYEARQIELFGAMSEKGYIYKGHRPVHWCSHCETALAEAEIEYTVHQSPSIYVSFEVSDAKGLFDAEGAAVIIWTTTPWTLPANLAIAVHPDLDYVLLETKGRRYLVAEGLALQVASQLGFDSHRVVERFKGHQLEGVQTKHPFMDRLSPLILGEHVTLEQGTGCVHTAPGHGIEDFEVAQRYGLGVLTPVDSRGRMTEEAGPYVGKSLSEANEAIINDLKDDGSLLHMEPIEHQYPYCWRCKNPIAFRATEQWFASVEGFRDEALAAIEEVKWFPSWGIERIRNMVTERSDWCISRQRVWGVPLPIFHCTQCREPLVNSTTIQAVATLFRQEGSDAWFVKEAGEILPEGTRCPNCGHDEFEKETDTMDVWFDSGSSHNAVLEGREELSWPADMYLEGSDQHRGWFQSSLLTAVATKNKPPYRQVLTHGFIMDGEGRKMSKSEGNTVAPEDVIKKYGADILRLWASSADYRGDIRVSEEILSQMAEVYRRIRNTCRFLLGNLHDFDYERDRVAWDAMREIDRWAVLRSREMATRAIAGYREYAFHSVHHLVHNFCTVDMGGFYLDVLKDRLYCDAIDSQARRSAQTAMTEILKTLVKMIAPILVFTAEEVWDHMPESQKDAESVHFSTWAELTAPADEPKVDDEQLLNRWKRLLEVRRHVTHALETARREQTIGSSTEAVVALTLDEATYELVCSYEQDLAEIFIVSGVDLRKDQEATEPVVHVEKAPGARCERCWRYAPGVGDHDDHPQLCTRCREVVA